MEILLSNQQLMSSQLAHPLVFSASYIPSESIVSKGWCFTICQIL